MGKGRTISINSSLSKRMHQLMRHVEKNVRYATAKAMNETAVNVQTFERGRVRHIYKIRTMWIINGIKVHFAKHGGALLAKVGYVAMEKAANVAGVHEIGGKHEHPGSKKGVGVPLDIRGAGRAGTTPESRWASGLLRRGARERKSGDVHQRYFFLKSKTKPGVAWLVSITREERKRRTLIRRAKGAKTEKGAAKLRAQAVSPAAKFKFWYKMQPESKIKPDLHFGKTNVPLARKLFSIHIRRFLASSLKERS